MSFEPPRGPEMMGWPSDEASSVAESPSIERPESKAANGAMETPPASSPPLKDSPAIPTIATYEHRIAAEKGEVAANEKMQSHGDGSTAAGTGTGERATPSSANAERAVTGGSNTPLPGEEKQEGAAAVPDITENSHMPKETIHGPPSPHRSNSSRKSLGTHSQGGKSDNSDGKKSHVSLRSASSIKSSWSARKARKHKEAVKRWPDPAKYNRRSLLLFNLDHPFRKLCIAAIEWKWWDRTVISLILLNTFQLALFDPFDVPEYRPYAVERDTMDTIGKVFSVLFAFECVVKVCAMGFFFGPKTFLDSSFNYLDLFIVILGILDFMPSSGDGVDLSALRALRALRPLRAAARFPELRFLIVLLIQSIPMLSNVFFLCVFIFFVFGILGVQTFQGMYQGRCFDIDIGEIRDEMCTMSGGMADCPNNFQCLQLGENMGRGAIGFDNIVMAMTAIFQIMTLEGWTDQMYAAQDTHSAASLIFFVALIFVGPMFAVQLFLVVISNSFADAKKDIEQIDASDIPAEAPPENENEIAPGKVAPMPTESTNQGSQPNMVRRGSLNGGGSVNGDDTEGLHHKKNKKSGWAAIHFKIRMFAKSDFLMNIVLCVIGLNTVSMAIDHDCDPCNSSIDCAAFKGVLELSNIGFTIIFVAEMVIKIVGLGPMKYFSNYMNLFDAVIVVVSVVELPTVLETGRCYTSTKYCRDYLVECEGGTGVSVLRTFRLVRIVKLMSAFPEIQKQVKVLSQVIGSVVWLSVLIFIFLFIFLVLGMNLFGGKLKTEWGDADLARGSRVFVDFPWDDVVRYGRVEDVDWVNHSSTPWKVKIWWGQEEQVTQDLRLAPDGTTWAATIDDLITGVPVINAVAPRFNFDDFMHAFITTFQLLTVEGWNDNLYDAIASTGPISGLYFYTLIVIGNWMLMNLMIAILIGEFAALKAQQLEENMKAMQERLVAELGGLNEEQLSEKLSQLYDSIDADGSGEIDRYELRAGLEELGMKLTAKDFQELINRYDADRTGTIAFDEFLLMVKELLSDAVGAVQSESAGDVFAAAADKRQALQDDSAATKSPSQAPEVVEPELPRSCFCLVNKNPFRLLCRKIARDGNFDQFILLCIGISSATLAMDRPAIGENSPERQFLTIMDLCLNGAFLFECIVKVVDQSFLEYIKSGWNKLDFLIVSTSVLDMGLTYGLQGQDVDLNILKIFRVFRILRALRPLRIIARARGLRILVGTLLASVKPVANTCAIAISVYLVLGILGMQLLSGKMKSCTDPKIWLEEECHGGDDDGNPREWVRYEVNFDNIMNAMRTMFIFSTMDDWPGHMWAGVDATGKLTGPFQDAHMELTLFYIFSLLLSAFLVMNVVIGVFVDCYQAAASQMEHETSEKLSVKDIPEVFDDPETGFRAKCFEVVSTTQFDMFIAFFIVTNVISMAFESYKPAQWQLDFDNICNYFFSLIFGWECMFKMFALHPRRYFTNGWNKFDFFIVLVSFFGIAVDGLSNAIPIDPSVLRILRIFRIFRILRAFRIFKSLKGLQAIVGTLIKSLPAIFNLFAMLGLLFFIFGILGVNLFGSMCIGGDEAQPGLKATRCLFTHPDNMFTLQANFKDLRWALLTLLRVTTGDAWGEVLVTSQLQETDRQMNEDIWDVFTRVYGSDPSLLPANDTNYFDKQAENATFEVAAYAIKQWNLTAAGWEDHPDYPAPEEAPKTGEWIQVMRVALANCLTSEEALKLQELGLADCTTGGYDLTCETTCGTNSIANLYYSIFMMVAFFVILQLVIAVLMDQLNAAGEEAQGQELMPGSDNLAKTVAMRMYRRWRWNAARALKYKRKLEKLEKRASAIPGAALNTPKLEPLPQRRQTTKQMDSRVSSTEGSPPNSTRYPA